MEEATAPAGADEGTDRAGADEATDRAVAVEAMDRAGEVEVTGRARVAEARVRLRAKASRRLPSPSRDNRPRRATHRSDSHGDFPRLPPVFERHDRCVKCNW